MLTDHRQKKVLEWVKDYYKKNKPSPKNKQDALHDIDHSIRDLHWAKILCEKEGADPNIVFPAVLLHDIGIPKVGDELHAKEAAKMCKPILKECGYTDKEIKRIAETIMMHSTDDPQLDPSKTKEGMVIFDADKLDATGPVTLHRWFFEYQKIGLLHHEAARKILDHIEKWKKKYGDQIFFTKTAVEISKKRLKYIEDRCNEILNDVQELKDAYDLI